MMGDSGREHVRCGKADRGEKRERRITPSPKPGAGTRRGPGRAEKWRHCQRHPHPHAPHNALPGTHSCPLASTQAHLLRGPRSPGLGEKGSAQAGPRARAQASGAGAARSTARPARQRGCWVTRALRSSVSRVDCRALREPERGELAPTSKSMPAARLSTSTPRTYRGPGGLGRERAWAGTHRGRAAERPAAPPAPPVPPPAAALAAVTAVLPVVLVGVAVVRVVVRVTPIPAVVIAPVAATVPPVVRSPI